MAGRRDNRPPPTVRPGLQTAPGDLTAETVVSTAVTPAVEPDRTPADAEPVLRATVTHLDGARQPLEDVGLQADEPAVGDVEGADEAAEPQIVEVASSANSVPAEVPPATNIVRFPARQERPAGPTPEWFELFPFTRSLARMNWIWWAHLRSESEARQAFVQALGHARTPADIIDLQTREMNRALDATISLHRVLAAQAPLFPVGASGSLRGAA